MAGDMISANHKPKRMGGVAAPVFLLLTICLLPIHISLAAEILPDPTRPAAEAGQERDVAAVPSGPVLQSVMIRPGSRTAVISGQLLAEGERFGDARLIRISEGEAVLSGPEGRQTLKLFPGVEKHFSRQPREEAPKRGKNKSKRNSE